MTVGIPLPTHGATITAGDIVRLFGNVDPDTPVYLSEPFHLPPDQDEPGFTDVAHFPMTRAQVRESEGRLILGRWR